MKTVILLALLSVCFNVIAGELSCSANGTFIWHIPGAFTSQKDQTDKTYSAKTELYKILNFELNKNKFDLKKQESDVIPIASQGLIQEKMNYLMMSIGDKYGHEYEEMTWVALGTTEFGFRLGMAVNTYSNSGDIISRTANVIQSGVRGREKVRAVSQLGGYVRSVTSLSGQGIRNINTVTNDDSVLRNLTSSPSGFGLPGKMIAATGILGFVTGGSSLAIINAGLAAKNVLNFASIWALEGDFNKALAQDQDHSLAAYFSTQDNIKNIAKNITEKLDKGQKVIINAHGEGNQLASRAIAQIQNTGTDVQRSKLSKYVSIVATSPTTGPYLSKYIYMKNDKDARILGGSNVPYNYVLKPDDSSDTLWNRVKRTIVLKSKSSSNFLDFYISPIQQGKLTPDGAYYPMRDNFIANLRASAELLEDNCLPQPTVTAGLMYPHSNKQVFFNVNFPTFLDDYSQIVYSWDFGDLTKGSGRDVTHVYNVYGEFTYSVEVKNIVTNESYIQTGKILVEPDPNFSVVDGTTVYKKLVLYSSDTGLFPAMFHKRAANFYAEGPVGAQLSYTTNSTDINEVDCGEWTRFSVPPYIGCRRMEGNPITTTFYIKSVTQCGGIGCEGVALAGYYIPYTETSIPVYYYSGVLPAPFDF